MASGTLLCVGLAEAAVAFGGHKLSSKLFRPFPWMQGNFILWLAEAKAAGPSEQC